MFERPDDQKERTRQKREICRWGSQTFLPRNQAQEEIYKGIKSSLKNRSICTGHKIKE